MGTLFLSSFAEQVQGQIQYFTHDWKALAILIFIGGLAGILAEFIVGSKGFPMIITIILGIIGSWLGNLLFKSYLSFTSNELINLIICATAGSMILVFILSAIFRLKERDRSNYEA